MRITGMELTNFKRFTHLTLADIPAQARLVLLIGANGSGKTCIFDALNWISESTRGGRSVVEPSYYARSAAAGPSAVVTLEGGTVLSRKPGTGSPQAGRFFGRSSLRVVPRIAPSHHAESSLEQDVDAPQTYIDQDSRFLLDVQTFTGEINRALRQPVFEGRSADTLEIFRSFVQPLNDSLRRVFQASSQTLVELAQFEDATAHQPARLIFRKGGCQVSYDLLSHGEKQVVITLLNFAVRRHLYQDAVVFIDELDAHLNTALQFSLLKEVTEVWLPENAQLWTASHSLGFIDYAREAPHACILDFDDLDFDRPVVVRPAARETAEVFEIAVPREVLPRLFQDRTLIFCENRDAQAYNSLGLEGVCFVSARDKRQAYYRALSSGLGALLDRDYLTEEEIAILQGRHPNIRFLGLYSLENYLYHPDNLAELRGGEFDRQAYILAIRQEKDACLGDLLLHLQSARNGYPFFTDERREHEEFLARASHVKRLLESEDFAGFYPVFPLKDRARGLPQRQNLNPKSLAATGWFRSQVAGLIAGL